MISAGSGITPLMSMLRSLHSAGYAGEILFLHNSRSRGHTIFGGELQALAAAWPALRLVNQYTSASGRLDAAGLLRLVPQPQDWQTLLCGPTKFMELVRGVWRERGLLERLSQESFTGALPRDEAAAGPEAEVRCLRSEKIFTAAGGPLLAEEAEAPGRQARLPHGHLPEAAVPQGFRHGGEPAYRRDFLRSRSDHSALHQPGPLGPCPRGVTSLSKIRPSATASSGKQGFSMSTVQLTRAQIDAFQAEMDAIRNEVASDLGQRDVDHIRRMIHVSRGSAAARPGLLMFCLEPVTWVLGVAALALILENMEIGHNVMQPSTTGQRSRRMALAAPTSGTTSATASCGATRTTTCTNPTPTSSARTATWATASCA